MSFSLPSIETLSIILDEPFLSNHTISFGEESIEVNKFVLAAHSTYFRSLWFLEFGTSLRIPSTSHIFPSVLTTSCSSSSPSMNDLSLSMRTMLTNSSTSSTTSKWTNSLITLKTTYTLILLPGRG
ncbi:hypothetical protein GEMRC1_000189 [Eukaryota sp. GEM-RC1]